MNVILNNFKRVTTRIVANLSRSGVNFSREYADNVADYKIFWRKVKRVKSWMPQKSGDLGLKVDVKPTDLCYKYDESPELKDADDIVKRMFTLEFLPAKETTIVKKEKFRNMVQRHELDRFSPESKVAVLTCQILHLQEFLKKNPRQRKPRVFLKEMIDKRRKYLFLLRKYDYRCFEWIVEKMNLVVKPFPSPPLQITRKESLTRLTEDYCNKIKQTKLDAYKAELKSMQKDFYKEKLEKLKFIREEELMCGLKPSVTEKHIKNTEQKVENYEV